VLLDCRQEPAPNQGALALPARAVTRSCRPEGPQVAQKGRPLYRRQKMSILQYARLCDCGPTTWNTTRRPHDDAARARPHPVRLTKNEHLEADQAQYNFATPAPAPSKMFAATVKIVASPQSHGVGFRTIRCTSKAREVQRFGPTMSFVIHQGMDHCLRSASGPTWQMYAPRRAPFRLNTNRSRLVRAQTFRLFKVPLVLAAVRHPRPLGSVSGKTGFLLPEIGQ